MFDVLGLKLMFSLLDRVPDGVQPMLSALEDYIITVGLADMKASADTITTVSNTLTVLVEHNEEVLELGFELATFSTTGHFFILYIFIFQDSSKYVELLLQLFRRFSELVKEAFSKDPRFLSSRDKV